MSTTPGFKNILLKSSKTTVYEPTNTFQNRIRDKDVFTNNLHAINQGGRYVHYHPNGGGRDTYIHNSNGGFTLLYQSVKWPEKGSIQNKPLFKKPPPNPIMGAKTVFYRNDGTGRDSYVG